MIKKIYQFIEGNMKMVGDQINLLPLYQKEQVLYRLDMCKEDCVPQGRCGYCGCSLPGKLYVKESCNEGKRFPDLMRYEEWKKFKEDNKIIIGVS